MKKPNDVRRTKLYRHTVRTCGLDPRRYARELRKVCRIHRTSQLGGAFLWSETPQGHGFWHDIANNTGEYPF